ncbi:Protein phosphatase 1L [Mortierella alpina]|nr:Protein phosphatase 1L [Mortierella alpina]
MGSREDHDSSSRLPEPTLTPGGGGDDVAAVSASEEVPLPAAPAQPSQTNGGRASGPEPSPAPTQKKSKPNPVSQIALQEPLVALPSNTPLPDLEDFNLRPEQMKNPLFVAITKVLLVYGNAWQSANDLVDGIRHFNLASLGGRTPKGTIQGAISTALALSAALGTFEPIEKQRMHSTTYYRMDPRALEIGESGASTLSEAGSSSMKGKALVTNPRRKPKQPAATGVPKKRPTISSSWGSDTMSSASSDDEDTISMSGRSPSSKRVRTGSPSSNSTRQKAPQRLEVPNGLKKLPKGYVYDTEHNQAALMNLSIDPNQTGEYMELLRGQAALENDYPDRRADYGVDLENEPSMFAVEQQIGYTYPRLRTNGRERLPKPDCEDGYAVADLRHNGEYLGRMFCITDGHGGRACSSFVIATMPGAMQVILGKYKASDLSLTSVQDLVKKQITEAVRLIDKEYLDYKKQQYLLYKAKKIPHDPGSDGTTLICNVFIDKWVICINVGDSRSMITSRDTIGRWNVDFYSEDHTPSLERLAQTIYANGGEFVTHDDKVIRFDPTLKNDKKHRGSLKEARIRVKDGASNLYGIPYRTRNGQCASINLGACIGDVLYKLDPVNPVLSCKPDITFIDISNIQQGYLLMASDGLWDYVLRGGKVHDQNAAVCQYVGDKLDRGWNHQRIVCALSDREGLSGLYSDSIQEYDDFTAILVTVSNKHLISHQPEQQNGNGVASPSPLNQQAPTQNPQQQDTQENTQQDQQHSGEQSQQQTSEPRPQLQEVTPAIEVASVSETSHGPLDGETKVEVMEASQGDTVQEATTHQDESHQAETHVPSTESTVETMDVDGSEVAIPLTTLSDRKVDEPANTEDEKEADAPSLQDDKANGELES